MNIIGAHQGPVYTWFKIRSQMDSRDMSPFTPVSIMCLNGVQITSCVPISLLPMSRPLDVQRAALTS